MIEYERIDISESIDIDKTNKSKECMLCHYWYFLNKNFNYGPSLCDGCYNIGYVSGNAQRIQCQYVSKHKRKHKRKAIRLMTNSNLIDKKGIL